MRKFNSILVLLLCILLPSDILVSAKETEALNVITFDGESENWIGTYTIETIGKYVALEGKLKYKDEAIDVDSIGVVTCTFETNAGKSVSERRLSGGSIGSAIGEKGTIDATAMVGDNNLHSKIKVVKATVEWDGNTESFDLYKQ